MEEAAVQPNCVPGGFHERFPKMFALIYVLNQGIAVHVALGVSTHRRVHVKKGHLVLRVWDRLAVNDERVDFARPWFRLGVIPDRSRLGVGHAPRLDGGGDVRLAVLASDMVQVALLDIDIVVPLFGVGTRWRWWCSTAGRNPTVQHQDDARLLHELHYVCLVRNAPKMRSPDPQHDRERELDAVP